MDEDARKITAEESNQQPNDYRLILLLEIDKYQHSARIDFEDGQPVNVDLSPDTHPAMLRLAQLMIHNGSGQPFRGGNAYDASQLGMVGAPSASLAPSYRLKGPNPMY